MLSLKSVNIVLVLAEHILYAYVAHNLLFTHTKRNINFIPQFDLNFEEIIDHHIPITDNLSQ